MSQICRCYATNRRCKRPFKLTVTGLGGATEQRLATAFPEYTKWGIEFKREPLEEIAVGRQLVYLSADAEETLDEIEPNYSYIIGGLIDRNRHKNIAAQRAKDLQIRSMKLPLSNHIKLKSSQVLTIVHVYDLLCQQRELDSWPEAIRAIIPDRKRSTDI